MNGMIFIGNSFIGIHVMLAFQSHSGT